MASPRMPLKGSVALAVDRPATTEAGVVDAAHTGAPVPIESHNADVDLEKGAAALSSFDEKDVVETASREDLDPDVPADKRGTAGLRRPWWSFIPFTPSVPAPPPPRSMDEAIRSPEFSAGIISRHTFSWIEPMMVLGTRRTLQAEDLWELEPSFASSELLSNRLRDIWGRRAAEAAAYNARLDSGELKPGFWRRATWTVGRGSEEEWRSKTGRKEPSVVFAVNELAGSWFWIGGAYKVFGDVTQICSPLVIRWIINFVRDSAAARAEGREPPSIGRGVGAAIGLSLMLLTASLCNHQFFYRSTGTGVVLRGALISYVFNKGLRITGEERSKGLGAGKLTNHISTDISRIDFAAGFFHLAWVAPIQAAVCLILLCINLGWPAITGFAFFVIIAPLQNTAMKNLMRERVRAGVYTDKRAKLLGELLNGMKLIKFFAWEIPYLDRLSLFRNKELHHIKNLMMIRAANMAFALTLPALSSVISFCVYGAVNGGLNAADVFASLSLFQLLRMPLMMLPLALSSITDASNAFTRLKPVFNAATLDETQHIDPDAELAIDVRDASFAWDLPPPIEDDTKGKKKSRLGGLRSGRASPTKDVKSAAGTDQATVFAMSGINLQIPPGKLVAVVGPVGSGKSSLVEGLIGEMKRTKGTVTFNGKLSYAPQQAWIMNATIRENVLFGMPWDEEKYWAVIAASCLEADLQALPAGDDTHIGEKGINLSGGQRQRVSIARCMYADQPIVILDDPLSAVDAHVGKSLFFGGIQGALAGSTRVLVTHQLHFLPYVDEIIMLDKGRIVEQGTYADLVAANGDFSRLMHEFGNAAEEKEEGEKVEEEEAIESSAEKTGQGRAKAVERSKMTNKGSGELMTKEEQGVGAVDFAIYRKYFSAGHGEILVPLLVLAICLSQVATVMTSYVLIWWSEGKYGSGNSLYMGLYGALAVAQALFTFAMGAAFAFITFNASITLFRLSITRVMRAPQSFFDTTPLGRISARFGKDFDNLDNMLPDGLRMLVSTAAQILSSIILIACLQPYFLIACVVVFYLLYKAAGMYRMSARELRRHQNVLRSAVYSTFGEVLGGLATVRAYGRVGSFLALNYRQVDLENRAYYMSIATQRWLGPRVDGLGNLLVFVCCIISITIHSLSPAEVGLALGYVIGIVQSLAWLVRQTAEVENDSTSVERVLHYANELPVEAPHSIPETVPPPSWPNEGRIVFDKVFMSYRPGLPNVLKGLSLSVAAAEKIGVVGRTGAGKSSIMSTLYRLQELNSGKIYIDDIDISTLGLTALRSGLSILPQEPGLFSGTIRSNLDPFGIYDDARLNDAMKRAYLSEVDPSTGKPKYTLDSALEDEGNNLSVGERSLVSLARALAKDSKIVVLDEATASVDLETDARIQETIRVEFGAKTMLTIAHRLRTILSYDRVLVMDDGQVAEFDTPIRLYDLEGNFRSMCDRSGISREDVLAAAELRDAQKRT